MHLAAAGNQGELGFDEEKGLLTAIAAHFLLVFDVITADAEDAPHRKQVFGVFYRKRWDIPQRNDVCHSSLSW